MPFDRDGRLRCQSSGLGGDVVQRPGRPEPDAPGSKVGHVDLEPGPGEAGGLAPAGALNKRRGLGAVLPQLPDALPCPPAPLDALYPGSGSMVPHLTQLVGPAPAPPPPLQALDAGRRLGPGPLHLPVPRPLPAAAGKALHGDGRALPPLRPDHSYPPRRPALALDALDPDRGLGASLLDAIHGSLDPHLERLEEGVVRRAVQQEPIRQRVGAPAVDTTTTTAAAAAPRRQR